MIKISDITRLEIIDETGLAFGRHGVEGVTLSGQDEGRTLKIFLDYGGEVENTTITVLQAVLWQLRECEDGREAAIDMIEYHLKQILEETDEQSAD